ncbi:hypothetical protein RQP46_006748 [Phenoliferia psychrophenolica]
MQSLLDNQQLLGGAVALIILIIAFVVLQPKAKPALDPVNWRKYKLQEKIVISPNTAMWGQISLPIRTPPRARAYRFALPKGAILGLPIGQHVSVSATIGGKLIQRSYTPTSSDDDEGFFDLLIKSYPTGNISKHFGELKVGDLVDIKGPKGQMIYSPDYARTIGMICGGTGITPMLQIIRAALKNPLDVTTLSLIYANVSPEDILLKAELDQLAAAHPLRFKVYYVLNNPPEKWAGGAGFVSTAMIKEHLPAPAADARMLLCGPPPMMTAMKKSLADLAFDAPRTVSKLPDQVFLFSDIVVPSFPLCSYEASDVIGTGSFGVIRKVKRRADGMILARKELNYGRMDERDIRQLTEEVYGFSLRTGLAGLPGPDGYLLAHSNILEQLGSNDNIVRYYERFVDKPNNMLYILMEYCEGGDLAGVIQRCRQGGSYLNEELVWSYLAQITLALYDCHSEVDKQGRPKAVILHRDIKPENVFMDNDNNLKLGDFGLSKAMAQAAMTQTYVGTPYYMSPELINGQPYDIKSDIWALGCLIYELCAGHPPFHEARTQPELAVLIREGKIPDLPKPYTPHLGQVVKAMLKQNPRQRPNTSQIKALDNVKLQIRVIELRKATKELRFRNQDLAAREADLLSREGAVLLREQAVLGRENNVRANIEAFKEAHAKAAIASAQQMGMGGMGMGQNDNVGGIPFPRLPSTSSLMSLDDTPIKDRRTSTGRRLASKSCTSLSGLSGGYIHPGTPSRTASLSEFGNLSVASPMSVTSFDDPRDGGSPSTQGSHNGSLHASPERPERRSPVPGAFRPMPPSPTKTHFAAAAPRPSLDPRPVPQFDPDDLPSPFLKKMDGSRFPTAASAVPPQSKAPMPRPALPGRAVRTSLGSKPTLSTRLLAARAQAGAASGVDEVGRRLLGVGNHLRNKSTSS